MRRTKFLSILVVMAMLALPIAAGALSLDVEAKAGGGLALGTTSNPNQTGDPRPSLGAGIDLDLYFFSVGPVDLGLSVGGEYSYLMFHGITNYPAVPAFGLPATTLTSDSTYNYLNIPIAIVGRIPLSDSLRLAFRAGGFIGYFLGGSSTLSYSQQVPGAYTNGTVTLNSSTTVQWEYGIHLTGGVDIALSKSLSLSPSIGFDAGLTNTNNTSGYTYSDTFWSLNALIGIKYNVF